LTFALVLTVNETIEEFRRREAIRTSGVRNLSIYSEIQLNPFFVMSAADFASIDTQVDA
jgi:hypothetical protein